MVSLLGQSIRVDKVYRRVPLEIQGVVFPANLMELPFGEFNLILGMDWLIEHRVSLDCAIKRVTLLIIGNSEIVFIDERQDYLSNVISTLATEKLLRKGYKAYLAIVIDSALPKTVIDI